MKDEIKKLKEAADSAQAAHMAAIKFAFGDSSNSACKAASVAADDAWNAYISAFEARDSAKED